MNCASDESFEVGRERGGFVHSPSGGEEWDHQSIPWLRVFYGYLRVARVATGSEV